MKSVETSNTASVNCSCSASPRQGANSTPRERSLSANSRPASGITTSTLDSRGRIGHRRAGSARPRGGRAWQAGPSRPPARLPNAKSGGSSVCRAGARPDRLARRGPGLRARGPRASLKSLPQLPFDARTRVHSGRPATARLLPTFDRTTHMPAREGVVARTSMGCGPPAPGRESMRMQAVPPVQADATLHYDGKAVTLPVIRRTEDETAVDIEKLRAQTGLITLDPGYGNTGSCRSAITFIDGEKGILRYRGYDIAELAEQSSFLEVSWLLLHGELPTHAQLTGFTSEVTHHTMLHETFVRLFEAMPTDAHPMPVCAAAVGALATFYQQPETEQNLHDTVVRLISKMPTIAAYSY